MPSPNPWYGIQGLVTRADPTGTTPGTLWPEQSLTEAEALHAYSLGVARAMGIDNVTGSLELSKSADFVVLDRDPFAVPLKGFGRDEHRLHLVRWTARPPAVTLGRPCGVPEVGLGL
jgi:predicted amidohydrolase YtcJ